MKTKTFLLILVGFMPFISYAQKPILNEKFEKFIETAPERNVEITSTVSWNINGTVLRVVDNPQKSGINKSKFVLQLYRAANPEIVKDAKDKYMPGANTYRGCYTDSYELNMTDKLCVIELKVLKNVAGKIGIRVYPDPTIRNAFQEVISDELPGSDKWQLVQFDFTGKIPTSGNNSRLLLQVEKNKTAEAQSSELTVYIDDIKLTTK